MKSKINYLLRSMLYVPTYKKSFLGKVSKFPADAIILDLEDAIPESLKDEARRNISEFLDEYVPQNGKKIFVRLNSIESKLLFKDLECVLSAKVDGFYLTKIYSEADMIYYEKLISQYENDYGITYGHFKFVPLIETASAVLDIYRIVNSTTRVVAVAFGGEDFLNDMGGYHGSPPKGLDYPRSQIALAARSVGALPIDTPYLKVHDDKGFCEEERLSFEMGFAGVQLIHPSQIELANRCFLPTESELEESMAIIKAVSSATENGSSVAMYNGNMIGPPMEKRARKMMDLVITAKNYE